MIDKIALPDSNVARIIFGPDPAGVLDADCTEFIC